MAETCSSVTSNIYLLSSGTFAHILKLIPLAAAFIRCGMIGLVRAKEVIRL